jgi:hypothetical protein
MSKLNIAAKLHSIENGILGVEKSPEIQEKMMAFGYTPEKMAQGKALFENAKRLTTSQVGGYGDQYAASDEVSKFWSNAYSVSMVTVKVIRIAFKGQPDMLAKFKATGQRNRSLSGWLNETRIRYGNLLQTPEALRVMVNYGYSLEKLTAERDAVEQVADLYSKWLTEKGEAQQGTVERDKAIDDLCNWYSDFRAIARVALYKSPQLLEALGIVKKS